MSVTRVKLLRHSAAVMQGVVPVPPSVPEETESITATVSSQQLTMTGDPGQVWEVQTMTADVEVAFGSDPTAGPNAASRKLTAGQIYYFSVCQSSEKMAVILAA